MAVTKNIVNRTWTKVAEFDLERSFECGPPSEIAASQMIAESGWTLFSFDFTRRQAVFLNIGANCDLSTAPFAYMRQFEQATRLAILDFDAFVDLCETLADVPNLVQFFNIGHCGSTLLHHVFNRVPDVWCISEPMAFINLAMHRSEEEPLLLSKLACGALRLLKFFPGAAAAASVVVKHFSQSTTQFALLHDAQPQSKLLFLYRDGLGWANSLYHFAQKHGSTMTVEKARRDFLWRIMSGATSRNFLDGVFDFEADDLTFDMFAAAAWALHMQQFADALELRVPLFPVRYNELVLNRTETLADVFSHLGLPLGAVEATLSAFEVDSHVGTRTARSGNDLDFAEENYARVRAILELPRFAIDPDVILFAN